MKKRTKIKSLCILIHLILIINGCGNKISTEVVQSITELEISNLVLDTIEIEREYHDSLSLDSVVIDKINIDINKLNEGNVKLMNPKRLLIDNYFAENNVIIEQAINDTVVANIPVKKIKIKSAIAKLPAHYVKGATGEYITASVNAIYIKNFRVNHIILSKKIKPPDFTQGRLEIAKSITQSTERRLKEARDMLNQRLAEQPFDAARNLPADLKELEQKTQTIKHFLDNIPSDISPTSLDVTLADLEKINVVIEDIKKEIGPGNTPITIANTVFFNSGQYNLRTDVNLNEINFYIKKVITDVGDKLKQKPKQTVIIYLTVIGYADEKGVSDKLKNELENLLNRKCALNEKQDSCLNQLLSEIRAKNVLLYLQEKIKNGLQTSGLTNFQFGKNEHSQFDYEGRGLEMPFGVLITCPDPTDCLQRRVSLISEVLIRQLQ